MTPLTIGFLVKKATQFDVPLFQHIARHKAHGYKFLVIYIQPPGDVQFSDPELGKPASWNMDLAAGYEWYHIPVGNTDNAFGRFLQEQGIGVLISNGYQGSYASYLQSARKVGIPLALRIDSVLFGRSGWQHGLRKWPLRWLYRHFEAFLTTGQAGARFLDKLGIGRDKQGWFPYCTSNQFFANPAPLPVALSDLQPGKKMLLAVCKFNQRENPRELIEAFTRLNEGNTILVMIGDGEQRAELETLAAKAPGQVLFPGYISYDQLPAWYQAADIFIHPARYEPWGVSIQEAMAAGAAVIASDRVGSGYDLISDGENGYRYPSGNIDRLTACLRKTLQLPKPGVRQANRRILEQWNYGQVWQSLQEACQRMVHQESK